MYVACYERIVAFYELTPVMNGRLLWAKIALFAFAGPSNLVHCKAP